MSKLGFKTKGILSTFGGLILHLVLGSFYLWGNLNIYFTSYFRTKENHKDLSPNLGILMSSGLDLLATFSMFLAVPISRKHSPRKTVFFSGAVMSLTTMLSSFIQNAYAFACVFTLLMGLGYGILWMSSLNNIFHYFPSKKGLCSGIILSGIGLGTSIGAFISQKVVNPGNEKPIDVEGVGRLFGESVAQNFPFGLRVIGIYFLGLTFLGSALTFNYCEEEHRQAEEYEMSKNLNSRNDEDFRTSLDKASLKEKLFNKAENETALSIKPLEKNAVDAQESGSEFSYKEELRHLLPHKLLLVNVFAMSAILFFSANFKNYGILYSPDDEYLSLVGSAAGISNGLARVLMGLIADKLGFLRTLIGLHFILLVFQMTVDLIVTYRYLYLIWVSMIIFVLGGRSPVLPAFAYHLFGNKRGAKLFPYTNLGCVIGNFFQFFLQFSILKSCGYSVIIYILGANTVLAFFILLSIKENKTK